MASVSAITLTITSVAFAQLLPMPSILTSPIRRSEFIRAVDEGDVSTVRIALRRCEDPNIVFTDGQTLLMRAIRTQRAKIVELLIQKGAEINVSDDFGYTPLMYAASTPCRDVVKLLLSRGAKVNDIPTGRLGMGNHLSALHCACKWGSEAI